MVNADDYYGEYLKAEDVKQDIQVKISGVEPETIDGEQKLVVRFHELRKTLVLNKTNKDRIKSITGSSETSNWTGKVITLTTEKVQFKGETVPALRVKEEAIDKIAS